MRKLLLQPARSTRCTGAVSQGHDMVPLMDHSSTARASGTGAQPGQAESRQARERSRATGSASSQRLLQRIATESWIHGRPIAIPLVARHDAQPASPGEESRCPAPGGPPVLLPRCGFTRRSVPYGVALGLFVGIFFLDSGVPDCRCGASSPRFPLPMFRWRRA